MWNQIQVHALLAVLVWETHLWPQSGPVGTPFLLLLFCCRVPAVKLWLWQDSFGPDLICCRRACSGEERRMMTWRWFKIQTHVITFHFPDGIFLR